MTPSKRGLVRRPPVRVLIVDDIPEMVEALSETLLDHEGIAVVGCAYDGAEAVRLATQVAPDVIVMDIRMPNMDGIAATKELAERLPAARVVLLSAYGDESLIEEGRRAGAVSYVLKGSPVADLARIIRSNPRRR